MYERKKTYCLNNHLTLSMYFKISGNCQKIKWFNESPKFLRKLNKLENAFKRSRYRHSISRFKSISLPKELKQGSNFTYMLSKSNTTGCHTKKNPPMS